MGASTVGTQLAAETNSTAMFDTRITRLFGIRVPILCGGLMWLADARYVAAVVNAGAMGFITARTFPDPSAFRAELQACRAMTKGRPFGVNLYMTPRPEENVMLSGHADILLEEGVRHVETAGLPPKDLLVKLKEAGTVVIHKTATLRHAESAARLDVDAVTLVGAECGGHPGLALIGSMVQIPLAAERITKPLVVGGGIGHGSQIAAALAMGADGVLIGTRMLVADEIPAHDAYKARMVSADENATRLIMTSFRNTFRVLDNTEARSVAELEADGERDFARYQPHVTGQRQREAYETGDSERGVLSMGQSVAFARKPKPVAGIIDDLMREAAQAMHRLRHLTRPS